MQRRTLLKALAAGERAAARGRRRRAGGSRPGATCSTRRRRRARCAARGLLTGLARAGKRLVAVGQRGHVLLQRRRRQDAGSRPTCRSAPTWSRCTSRRRRTAGPSATTAWCCTAPTAAAPGRASSTAAGLRRRAGRALQPRQPATRKWLAEAQALRRAGRREPVPRRLVRRRAAPAIVVGAFGLMLRTADGGKTWEPLLHAADNPKSLHLYAVRARRRRRCSSPASRACCSSSTATAAASRALDAALQGHAVRPDRQRARRASPTACAATSCAAPTAARSWQQRRHRRAASA